MDQTLKKVIFVRHAKSSWVDFSISDFERSLDNRGLHDAPIMAKRLKSFVPDIDTFLSSDAKRAKMTAEIFAAEYSMNISYKSRLYHGEPEDYLFEINQLDESCESVILFGHNPGITILANMIKENISFDIPTCGILIATISMTKWTDVGWNSMKFGEYIFPKDNKNEFD